jgi:hypothetical protein
MLPPVVGADARATVVGARQSCWRRGSALRQGVPRTGPTVTLATAACVVAATLPPASRAALPTPPGRIAYTAISPIRASGRYGW